jgi:Trypsin
MRTHSRFLLLTAVLAAVGCSPQPEDEVASAQAPIVNGITDANHRYVVGVGGNTRAFCTGTVISKRTVLTAGHCIGAVRNIFVGPKITTGATFEKIPVVKQIRHPMYADLPNENATYDLGILQLGADAPVQAVPLLRETMDNSKRYIGPSLTFVGYGITSGLGGGFGTKRVTTFPIQVVGPATVGGSFGELPETLFYYVDTKTMGRSACNGDSGGPSFFITEGVETLAGVTSSGDAECTLDGSNQRSDQPYIDGFIQAHIDEFEPDSNCKNDGACNESCNQNGQLGDPDCAFAHCAADGICAEACVAPVDPDCSAIAADNCGDNGVCDPKCDSDPDCSRYCGAEGNCVDGCETPDPDCTPTPPEAPDAGPDTPPQPASPDAGPSAPDDEINAGGGGCGCQVGRATGIPVLPIPLLLLALSLERFLSRLRRRRD